MTFSSIKSSGRHAFRMLMSAILSMILASCGGGGGEPGSGTPAGRFSISLASDSSSVFFGGSNAIVTISLKNNCTGTTGTSVCSTSSDVSGQVINLSSDVSSAVTFSPSIAITDKDGNAQVTIASASTDVSGIVNIIATATLSGFNYSGSMAIGVNTQVDRTISAADNNVFTTVDATADCKWFSYMVNVQNSVGTVQDNSIITAAASTNAEVGLKSLGVFKGLGQVWWLQIRPNTATCLVGGATPVIGEVDFIADPGDGSKAYSFAYRISYKTK